MIRRSVTGTGRKNRTCLRGRLQPGSSPILDHAVSDSHGHRGLTKLIAMGLAFQSSGRWPRIMRLAIVCLALGRRTVVADPPIERVDRPAVFRSEIESGLGVQIDHAIQSGSKFLLDQQHSDGTWRSKTYGLLKDGTSLTPLVMWALPDGSLTESAKARGLSAVTGWIDRLSDSPQLTTLPQYPVYTAGLMLQALPRLKQPDSHTHSLVWRQLLIDYQLSKQNGWSEKDAQFGGWGYSHEKPQNPEGDLPFSPLDEPNLSATRFAMLGLVSVMNDDPELPRLRQHVLRFVQRCQNYRDSTTEADGRFNDGGFYFLLNDDVRNKPGVAGTDSSGTTRYISYGSTTSDGLRLLQLCGLDPRHPRRVVARQWLLEHLTDSHNPGHYPSQRQHLQPALDFYYAASLASALQREQADAQLPATTNWSAIIAERMIKRQLADGRWQNDAVDVREDDPLIATSLALHALQVCQQELRLGGTAGTN